MRSYALLWPLAAFLVTRTSGSAIPMWEFLSRGEKVTFGDYLVIIICIIVYCYYLPKFTVPMTSTLLQQVLRNLLKLSDNLFVLSIYYIHTFFECLDVL